MEIDSKPSVYLLAFLKLAENFCVMHLKVIFKVVKLFLLDRLVSHKVLNTVRILLLDTSILIGKKEKQNTFTVYTYYPMATTSVQVLIASKSLLAFFNLHSQLH